MTVTNNSLRWSQQPNPILVNYLPELKAGSLLDIGGSNGVNSLLLAKNGFEVTTIDIATDALDELQEKAKEQTLKIHTIPADLNSYIIDSQYDNVICFYTFHFLDKTTVDKLLNNIQQVTNIGGLNIIIGFTDKGEFKIREDEGYFTGDYLINKYSSWEVKFHDRIKASSKSGLIQQREILVARKLY